MPDRNLPCTIGLGSNTPDRDSQIQKAIGFLNTLLVQARASGIYESAAANGKDAPYLNAVVHGISPVGSHELVRLLKEWESTCGRTRQGNELGLVPIDLDLVIYNSRILRPKDFERHYFNQGYRELLAEGAFLDA